MDLRTARLLHRWSCLEYKHLKISSRGVIISPAFTRHLPRWAVSRIAGTSVALSHWDLQCQPTSSAAFDNHRSPHAVGAVFRSGSALWLPVFDLSMQLTNPTDQQSTGHHTHSTRHIASTWYKQARSGSPWHHSTHIQPTIDVRIHGILVQPVLQQSWPRHRALPHMEEALI